MKIIDKTSSVKNKWDYGTILKCWDNDPKKFSLLKISRDRAGEDSYRLDILWDQSQNEGMVWSSTYSDTSCLKDDLKKFFEHVVRVKATITIENFEGEQNEDQD